MGVVKRIGRRTKYQTKWMKLHEDTVRFADGTEGIYDVVDKPDYALIVPRREDGHYQLVEQFR